MSMKPNYFKIGIFVIVAFTLILIAIVVFGAGLLAEDNVYFETYFDSSVSGLSIGAPVEYRGVRIGRVEKITFVRNEYEIPGDSMARLKFEDYIMVISSADEENLPALTYEQRKARLKQLIKNGLRVRLASNILTGLAFLQADYLVPEKFPPIEIKWEPKRPYIPSAPGEFSTIKDSVDSILYKLEKIDTEKIGLAIEEVLVTLKEAIRDANIPEVTLQLNRTLQRIDKLIASEKPEIEQSLENLREVSTNLKDLTETLKRHPSNLIFSKPPPKSEVLK